MDNTSSEATESDHKPLLSKAEGVTWCTAYVITAVAIVTGNLLVVVVFARSRSFRRKKFCLLVNLAVVDLLVGGVAVPLDVYIVLPDYFDLWQLGESFLAVRYAATFFVQFTLSASIINLTMISLERFYATFFAFRYRQLTYRPYILVLTTIWVLAVLPYACYLLQLSEVMSISAFFYFRILFAAALLLTICLAYLSIWIKLKWGRTPRIHRANQRENRLTVILFRVTALSLIAWLPMQLLAMATEIADSGIMNNVHTYSRVNVLCRLLLFGNSLVNPILYTVTIPQFKAELVRLCRRT